MLKYDSFRLTVKCEIIPCTPKKTAIMKKFVYCSVRMLNETNIKWIKASSKK